MPRLNQRLTLARRFSPVERVFLRVLQRSLNQVRVAAGLPALTDADMLALLREALRHVMSSEGDA